MTATANRGSNAIKICETFQAHEDGLTLKQLVEQTGLPYVSAYKALARLSCVYVDRWVPDTTLWKWMPVHCMADGDPPDDTPKPSMSVKKYLERRA